MQRYGLIAESRYLRGSEWRKWDLHIHTPDSIYQEYKGGEKEDIWDKFINVLASLPPEIKVIGITDYLFLDGYKKVLERRGEIPNIELIIPNIEFRLSTFSGTENSTKRHNFHVLFDPEIDPKIIQEQLLNSLSTAYLIENGQEWNQTPTYQSLEELGAHLKASAPPDNSIHSKSDLRVGFENITYDLDDLLKNLKKDPFRGRHLVAIGYSEWDQSRWDQSAATKRSLINRADLALTAGDDLDEINKHIEDLENNKLNSIVLHSSDAHNFERIGKTKLWIKADPTFAGLKQILNEPKARAFIGDHPLNKKHDHQTISKVTISNSNDWFQEDFVQELNSDLVAVIGGRGSGKSAFLEMIAFGAGHINENEDSFINKASRHQASIENTTITLSWKDDNEIHSVIGKSLVEEKLVQYLPQEFIELLCSPDHDQELIQQIESVIFQALDDIDKGDAPDFGSLRERLLVSFKLKKEKISQDIQEANKRIYFLKRLIDSLPAKRKDLDLKKRNKNSLVLSLPKLSPQQTKDEEELAELIKLKKKFEEVIIGLNSKISKIPEIETKVDILYGNMSSHQKEIISLASSIGITSFDVFEIKLARREIAEILNQRKNELKSEIEILKKGSKSQTEKALNLKDLPYDNLLAVSKAINDKLQATKNYETTKQKYQQQKSEIAKLEREIDNLKREIERIEKEYEPELHNLKADRANVYASYFEVLKNEKVELEKLYNPLQQSLLNNNTEAERSLKFEAKYVYDLQNHLARGVDIIDRTRRGNFREVEVLKQALQKLWKGYEKETFEPQAVAEGVVELFKKFTQLEGGEKIQIDDQIKQGFTSEDFSNWFFAVDHFQVTSSLSFNDTDLHLLSPGQKGIVLLMLYLEIDKSDTRPLIIDQPEDNLDNLSVYEDLIVYFRERKLHRQIIISTHNPNLVVNTDTEQVIVAHYDGKGTPRLTYSSGSLESSAPRESVGEDFREGIIENVCSVLEGGIKAFLGRKKKYEISNRAAYLSPRK